MGRSSQAVRAISHAEADILSRALEFASVDTSAKSLVPQINGLNIVGHCECGCASIDFRNLAEGETARLVADGVGQLENGEQVGVMVWAFAGVLSGLEVVGYSDEPAPLPIASSVKGWAAA